jgi:hypothetical protein
MGEVYKFFGFGENFINVMDTIGTGRTASIIFEDGEISQNFDLETGRPQGDGSSPLQYNMGEEIVLLKIELDPRVASVFTALNASQVRAGSNTGSEEERSGHTLQHSPGTGISQGNR